MKYAASEFKFLSRGFNKTIILIPGWGFDFRIFSHLELNRNYLIPVKFDPFKFIQDLRSQMSRLGLNKISLFGWSLGAFLASEFALKNPNLLDELILISVRERYDAKTIKETKFNLLKNKIAYLYKFYLSCFSADKLGSAWFRKNLLKIYLSQMQINDLIKGLDYLALAEINAKGLARIDKVRIFHGQEDKIAPIIEARKIARLIGAKFFNLPKTGHLPFLGRNFSRIFNHG